MTLALTIYITDEPLGVTGYGTVAFSPVYTYVGLVVLTLVSAYLLFRPARIFSSWWGRQP